jgi:hypothetical protein
MRHPSIALLGCALMACPLFACKDKTDDATDDTGPVGWTPDLVCPGDAGCADNVGSFQAGAAARSITPTCFESWRDCGDDGLCPEDPEYPGADSGEDDGEYNRFKEDFLDCGCDQICPDDEGWTAADEGEGDGSFQAVWMAGFQNGRPAMTVHDELWARSAAFKSGETTVAIVVLDVVGWFYDDTLRIRQAVADLGVDVDLVMVQATHSHEGPDTLGQWGSRVGVSGVNDDWMADVVAQAADAVAESVASLEDATLTIAAASSATPFGDKGTANTIRDSRDPKIIDEQVYVAHAVNGAGETITTLVNWGNHPEVLSDENTSLTSDFADPLRNAIEGGMVYESRTWEGVGGTALYVNGTVGGLMTPLGITVTDWDGVDHSGSNWEKNTALGHVIAGIALDALAAGTVAESPTVSLRTKSFYVPMENYAFQAMYLMGVFARQAYNYDTEANLGDDNIPEIWTEVDVIDIGPIRMLTVPGEMAPELAVGGYDGSRLNTNAYAFVDEENSNPPDLESAPDGPYLKDLMGAEHNWIIGLGNDEIGYLLPPYDYQLHETIPYLEEAEGDHYEETNSVGPNATPLVLETARQLIGWQ